MKLILSIILYLSFWEFSAQELKCIDFTLYNENYDAVWIKSTTASNVELQPDSIQIIVLPNALAEFPKWTNYKRKGISNGFKVMLVNNSTKDFNLGNIDGKVILKRQVYYKNQWIYIKSYKKNNGVWCGNSYFHDKFIKSGETFTYALPCLNGNIKTKFRFVAYGKTEKKIIYSNEFEGYINKKLIE